MLQSLHVPASTVQRVVRVVRWVAPWLVAGLTALVGLGWNWIMGRVSIVDVGNAVAPVSKVANEAQADSHHASSMANDHSVELAALWALVISMRAEQYVMRAYGKADPQSRSEYIDAAQKFYALRFEEQLRTHANNPAEAARLALLEQWRPDRRTQQ